MGDQHITYFRVENFKRFKSLELENLGQFNLIVGDNNVGKTSALEALLVTNNFYDTFNGFIYVLTAIKKIKLLNYDDFFDLYLFRYNHNAPFFLDFSLTFKNKEKASYKFYYDQTASEYIWDVGEKNFSKFHPSNFINSSNAQKESDSIDLRYPFVPYGFAYDQRLTGYYSTYIQLDSKKRTNFISSLSKIIPGLSSIEVSTPFHSGPSLYLMQEGRDKAMPLATFGDGLLKLFRLLIAIVVHKGKRLMIDEIETGIHFSRITDFWKVILEAAVDNDVQLFATTHSKECMEGYYQALHDLKLELDGRIIRMADTKKGVKAFTMKYEEFENAFMAESEIR